MPWVQRYPSSFFPQPYVPSMMPWSGISFGTAGVSSPSCVTFQLFVHPQPPHRWGNVRSRNALMLLKCRSIITKTPLCYQHFCSTNSEHSPIQATLRKSNSIPSKINTSGDTQNLTGHVSEQCTQLCAGEEIGLCNLSKVLQTPVHLWLCAILLDVVQLWLDYIYSWTSWSNLTTDPVLSRRWTKISSGLFQAYCLLRLCLAAELGTAVTNTYDEPAKQFRRQQHRM